MEEEEEEEERRRKEEDDNQAIFRTGHDKQEIVKLFVSV